MDKALPLLLGSAALSLTACTPDPGVTTPGIAEIEFIQTCAGIVDFETAQAAAKASGWDPVLTTSDPALSAVVTQGVMDDAQVIGGFESLDGNWAKETTLYEVNASTNRMAYKKVMDGRDFHLVLMTNRLNRYATQYGCFLYDFQEGYVLDFADKTGMIREWLQKDPSGANDQPGLTSARMWGGAGLPPGIQSVGAVNVNYSRKVKKNAGYYGRSWFVLTHGITEIKRPGSE